MSNHYDHIHEARTKSFDSTGQYLPDSEIPAINNGGDTDYYLVPPTTKTLHDLIEHKNMNFSLGNIFKAVYRLNDNHHSDQVRELNKIIWFANRELNRIKGNK